MSVSETQTGLAAEPAFLPDQVLVVIPTLNEEDHIEACIRSLMRGDPGLAEVSIIVADGGSADTTVEIANRLASEYPAIQTLHNPARLQAAAINLAVEQSAHPQARYLVRCDAHSLYPDNFIADVVTALQAAKAQSLVVSMDAMGRTCFEKANAWIVDTPLGSGGAAHRGGRRSGYVDHGHHAGFDLAAFRELGGYDETFSHNEDAEFDHRLAASGGRIFLDADIRIAYIPRGSLPTLARQYFRYGKGRARNIAKHGQALKLRQALPIFALIACMLGLGLGIVYRPALLVPAGYLLVLGLASVWMTVSRCSMCGLWCGVISGTMHMSWAAGFLAQSLLMRVGKVD